MQALFDSAVACQKAGQFAEAIVIYKQMIALEPDLPGVYSNLGHIFGALGRLSEAEHALRMAISLKPDFAEAFSNLGNTLEGPWQAGGSPIGASSGHPSQSRSLEGALQSWRRARRAWQAGRSGTGLSPSDPPRVQARPQPIAISACCWESSAGLTKRGKLPRKRFDWHLMIRTTGAILVGSRSLRSATPTLREWRNWRGMQHL